MQKVIAIVANSTWNVYNFRLNVINRLIKEKYKIIVLAPVDEYIEYKEKYPEVKHFNIRMLDRDSTNPIKDILLTLELIRKYRKIKPDLVVHYTNKPNIYGGVAARICGYPSIAMVTGLGYAFIRNGVIRQFLTSLYKFTSFTHERFIFENIADRELFEKLNIISRNKGVSIKGCGVDSDYYAPRSIIPSPVTTFSFIGRLLYDKGVKEFVLAAKQVKSRFPDTRFWLIGELDHNNPATVDRDELNKWINEGVVEYQGFKRDVRQFISQSTCVVLPSYREAIPRSITEAMAMAKPVITTDVAGCREAVIEGENGFLVPSKNVDELGTAMIRIINTSREDLAIMGQKGRHMVETLFDDKIIADQIVNIYKKTMYE